MHISWDPSKPWLKWYSPTRSLAIGPLVIMFGVKEPFRPKQMTLPSGHQMVGCESDTFNDGF